MRRTLPSLCTHLHLVDKQGFERQKKTLQALLWCVLPLPSGAFQLKQDELSSWLWHYQQPQTRRSNGIVRLMHLLEEQSHAPSPGGDSLLPAPRELPARDTGGTIQDWRCSQRKQHWYLLTGHLLSPTPVCLVRALGGKKVPHRRWKQRLVPRSRSVTGTELVWAASSSYLVEKVAS